jgi:hypothetical protein
MSLTYTTLLRPDEYKYDWESHRTWLNQNLQSLEHHYYLQEDYLVSSPKREDKNVYKDQYSYSQKD